MNSIRSVAVCVLLVLVVSVGSLGAAGGRGAKKGSTEGTFVRIDRDYQTHFIIKEKEGQEHWFLIRNGEASSKPYLDDPAKFKGQPVKVYWIRNFTGDGFVSTLERVESLGETRANER